MKFKISTFLNKIELKKQIIDFIRIEMNNDFHNASHTK